VTWSPCGHWLLGANFNSRLLPQPFVVARDLAPPIAILRKIASRVVGGATRVFLPRHESPEGIRAAMAAKLYRMLLDPVGELLKLNHRSRANRLVLLRIESRHPNAADGSRWERGRFPVGSAVQNGSDSCSPLQERHPQRFFLFLGAAVAPH
jgi:hypothetical protein